VSTLTDAAEVEEGDEMALDDCAWDNVAKRVEVDADDDEMSGEDDDDEMCGADGEDEVDGDAAVDWSNSTLSNTARIWGWFNLLQHVLF
jgi:hypothetical protein